jgi:hypothetical protein
MHVWLWLYVTVWLRACEHVYVVVCDCVIVWRVCMRMAVCVWLYVAGWLWLWLYVAVWLCDCACVFVWV